MLSGMAVPLLGWAQVAWSPPLRCHERGAAASAGGDSDFGRRRGGGGRLALFGREVSRKGLWKLLIPRGQGRVIGVNLRRSIQGGVVALALVLSGCSWFDSDGSSSSSQSPEPSPTPTEFEQSFAGAISGDDAVEIGRAHV